MTFAGVYAIVVGVGMLGQWGFSLATRRVPELQTEPLRIAFHLAGEFLTALLAIAAGIGLLSGGAWGRPVFLVAAGMLLYTIIVSPGYFAQRREWPLVAMFAALFVLNLVSLVLVW